MQASPLNAQTSPLTDDQARQLGRLVESLSPEQAQWVSGYLAGLRAAGSGAPATSAAGTVEASRLTILYGSETGNAESVAQLAGERAKALGLTPRVVDMADYKPRELKHEQLIMIVTATHGEGDPPDPAAGFYEYLHSRKAPKLAGTRFAVLGLGDSSYEHFCQTGKDLDVRLEALGAERLHARVDCDVDFEEAAQRWVEDALGAFSEHAGAAPQPNNVVDFSSSRGQAPARYDRRNPFHAEVLENLALNGRGSDKETRHIELSLEGSRITYEPGDVLCVVPRNRDETVAELIEAAGLDGEAPVAGPDGETTLAQALRHDYEITRLSPPVVQAYAEAAESAELRELLQEDSRRRLVAYAAERQVVDLVTEYPVQGLDAQRFLDMLRRLQPREYSIASSYEANPEAVHITVAAVRYQREGNPRYGAASTYLADGLREGDTVPVYIRRNKHFKLPEDPAAPIVMIGPGTGVAPFRAFLEERAETGAAGRSWLFFGDRHSRTDFLYQTEWQHHLKEGALERMDVAFSRDGDTKEYVQHRMLERSAELYRWLEDGAHVYVCGDAQRMAGDVHDALLEVVRREGSHTRENAAEYVKRMQQEKRYQRDVY